MKKILHVLAGVTFLLGGMNYSSAQTYPQLVNGNMEQWDNASNDNIEPTQYNSFKTANCHLSILCGSAQGKQVERSTDIRPGSTGTYSARIFSRSVFGVIANGNLTTGRINMGSATADDSTQNYNYTDINNTSFRMPISEVPDSIVWWAKYSNSNASHMARMNAVIHNNTNYQDPMGVAANRVATATLNYTRNYVNNAATWKRMSAPFIATNNGATPSYILLTFTTNNVAGGGSGSDAVLIDDVQLIYNPKLNVGAITPLAYTVSSIMSASISVPFTLTGPSGSVAAGNVVTAQLSNASGSFANPIVLGTLTTTTSGTITGTIPAGTPAGTGYRVRVVSSNPAINSTANTSNITINVITQSVTPTASQSILLSQNGNTLTVNSSVAATSQEWKFSTTPGGPYQSFSPAQTGTTYTPNFSTVGTYYVVAQSLILGNTYTSNEVQINVNNISINTGAISGSPYLFSASAPAASINVPFTVSGGNLNAGNIFTAQLSDASGSFAAPLAIGTLAGTTSGTISAQIPANTPSGNAYRIRVISSNFALTGGDNGVDLEVIQFANSISPAGTVNVAIGIAGSPIQVTENQTATRVWQMATTTGGPYSNFNPSETNTTYTPLFNTMGTYYVVCKSVNAHNDTVTSNEVEIIVANGTNITTTNVADTVLYVSPSANFSSTLTFSTDVLFQTGNVFTVEMSDAVGSFASPEVVGTLTSDVAAPISIQVPATVVNSSDYKFRVVSSDPVIVGNPGNVTAEVVEFTVNITSLTPQYLFVGGSGLPNTAYSSHPGVTFNWGTLQNNVFTPLNPTVTTATITPSFNTAGTYIMMCNVTNQWGDTLNTPSFEVNVESVGLEENDLGKILVINQLDNWAINFTESSFNNPLVTIFDMQGRLIYSQTAQSNGWVNLQAPSQSGVYIIRLSENGKQWHVKLVKAN